jgi:hypothetical protein
MVEVTGTAGILPAHQAGGDHPFRIMATMRSLRGVWIAVGIICALALIVGFLTQQDEYAFLRRFHPTEKIEHETVVFPDGSSETSLDQTFRRFDFACDPKLVLASFPVPARPMQHVGNAFPTPFTLPSGLNGQVWNDDEWLRAFFIDRARKEGKERDAFPDTDIRCVVLINETNRPSWLAKTWKGIKHRLGL